MLLYLLLGLIAFLFFGFIVVMFLHLKVYVDYFRINRDDNLKIEVIGPFGFPHYRVEFSYIKLRNTLFNPVLEMQTELYGVKGRKRDEVVKEEFKPRAFNLKKLLEKVKFLIKITDQFEAMMEMMRSFRNEDKYSEEIRMENIVIYRVAGMLFMGVKGNCCKLIWHTNYGFSDAALTAFANGLIWAGKSIFVNILGLICQIKTVPEISVTPNFQQVGVEVHFESIFSVRIGNIMYAGLKVIYTEFKRRAKTRWPIIQLRH